MSAREKASTTTEIYTFMTQRQLLSQPLVVMSVVAGFFVVGLLDFVTGAEIRIYPLYFLPLSMAAWHLGRVGAVLSVALAVMIWVVSNSAAGMQYTRDFVWAVNTISQSVAFGTVAGLLYWARSLLEREKALSRTDGLTGLANVRAFRAALALESETSRRRGRPLTLAYIDLDNFKCVNDRHGHSRGDELLREVAQVLRASLRVTDVAARMGGDEFAICLPETGPEQARALLERLRGTMAEALAPGDCRVSASIGAFCWNSAPDSIDAMIAAADQKMYEVKKGGKNRVEVVYMAGA